MDGEWVVDRRAVIDLSEVEVPDTPETRAYMEQCAELFRDPDLRLVTDHDGRRGVDR